MEAENVSRLIERIKSISSNASGGVLRDEGARTSLIQASRELTIALEPPYEVASRVALISGGGNMCVRLAVYLDLFDQLTLADQPASPEQLAVQSQADPALVRRMLRVLAGMGFVGETVTADRKQAFVATAVTKHMTTESVKAGIWFLYVVMIACSSQYDMFAKYLHLSLTIQGFPILAKAPAYFKSNGFNLPQGQSDGPFNFAEDTPEDCFTFWSKQLGVLENFNVFMGGVFGAPAQLHCTDWFPFEEICLNGFDPRIRGSDYTWVDVGGGKGHHVQQLVDKYPNVRGKFAVQDLGFVIEMLRRIMLLFHRK